MSVADLPREERRLAADPRTEPAVLSDLATDVLLVGALIANPSTPEQTRDALVRDFPHLRPRSEVTVELTAEQALESARRRQRAADRRYEAAAARSRPAVPTGSVPQVVHVGTNGLAITSFVLALVGGSVLAVIFGHVARSQIARTGEQGAGLALAGLVIGYLALAVSVLLVLVAALL